MSLFSSSSWIMSADDFAFVLFNLNFVIYYLFYMWDVDYIIGLASLDVIDFWIKWIV